MIAERLFMEKDAEQVALKGSFCESREFLVVEENVIYYSSRAAVCHKRILPANYLNNIKGYKNYHKR